MKLRVRTSSLSLVALLAGVLAAPSASSQQDASTRAVLATHLATAQVSRADVRSGRLTLRSDGRTIVVETDAGSPSIRGLRAGMPVMVGYREVRGPGGRPRHVLVALQENTPGPAVRSAGVSVTAEPVQAARVVHVDARVPTIAVEDSSGTVHVLSTSPAVVPTLRQLQPGDLVNVSMGRMANSDVDLAVRVDRLGRASSTPVMWPRLTAEPAPAPWTTTVAPPSPPPTPGGIPLNYVLSSIPSVPAPTPAPQLALPPAGASVALPGGEIEVRRMQGAHDFEVAAAQLAAAADTMDRAWSGHRELCITGPLPTNALSREWFLLLGGSLPDPDRDDCRVQRDELERVAQRFRDQVQVAVDNARGADVAPGYMRDVLVRHRIVL